MKQYVLIVALAGLAACKTHGPQDAKPDLVGRWYWVQSDVDFNYTTRGSGFGKILTFINSGAVYIVHNDSGGGVSPLILPNLLPDTVTDTTTYHLGAAPAFTGTFQAVFIKSIPYQYWMSGDTLVFATGPQLNQPDEAKYLRADVLDE